MQIHPKKSLGQHWLYDVDVLYDIADTAQINPGDHVLEIGPGLGTLTEVLLSHNAHVIAVEYDTSIFEKLKAEASSMYSKDVERLRLINQDILKFDLSSLPKNYKVVANIPYYLTGNLMRLLCETPNPPISATLLVQKEVAGRLCAQPGKMSLLSVSTQMYFECSLGSIVPAKLFSPPPKVDSQIVHLVRRELPLFNDREAGEVFRVIKAGFSNRRKTLLNSLSGGLAMPKEQVKLLVSSAAIDPAIRPQQLSVDEWIKLSAEFSNL